LKSWVLDTYAGRKLGLPSTRSAWRGLGGSPSPGTSNLWMDQGDASLEALIAGTRRGLLVTDTVGGGANVVTGDFSQGVVGLWIEDGQIAYPVEELTIAGTLAAMWQGVDGIANDRHPARATSAPSIRIGKMTVAGR
jgi:PmbA protein